MGIFKGVQRQSIRLSSSISKLKQDSYYKMSHNVSSTLQEQQNDCYFGTEVINRISFLREDTEFISSSAIHPSTRFIFFDNANPLVDKRGEQKLIVLANGDGQLRSGTIQKGLLSEGKTWSDAIEKWSNGNKDQDPELRDGDRPTLLLLGIEDESVGLNLQSLKSDEDPDNGQEEKYLDYQGRYQGIPYYAVDLSHSPDLKKFITDFVIASGDASEENLIFTHSRKHHLGFTHKEASLYSHGKMFLDWLARNKFCPGCGSKVIPIHAGGKLRCTNDSVREAKESKTEYNCPVKNASVSNVSFPRTDAVIITAITNAERTKILLSLAKRYAETKLYACTAGFMEPSETVEVATKREIWEETGIVCSDIKLVMTQPWPFPGNLMIGCLGVVEFNGVNEVINLGHDRELADARWFDVDFIKTLIYETNDSSTNPEGILLPSPESIAFSLIKSVIDQASSQSRMKL